MGIAELVLVAVSLAMDAFAVSLCQGLSMRKIMIKRALLIALFFGGFQALMPLVGAFLGDWFSSYIDSYSPYIAFGLLLIIGAKMIFDACTDKEQENGGIAGIGKLFVLAIATSIDALAVGVTLPSLWIHPLWIAITIIGVLTAIISFCGVCIGNKFGVRFKKKAEIAGGIVLVVLGIKILVEHLIGL
ncbi:MAG: manganese efflux pump MntP family protein [Eubacteriales bacterium]|nr:manganese efflux pump MntP family protein [Eubacteriales bacterium]